MRTSLSSFRPSALSWLFTIFLGLIGVAHADADPSLTPVRSIDDETKFAERYRFRLDFNGDGVLDLAISEPIPDMGRMGGMFELHIASADGSDYEFYEVILLHPKAISAEKVPQVAGKIRIWTYLRGAASYGGLGYYEVSKHEVAEFHGIEINAGDGGTSTGNAMLAAVFARSELKLNLQRSESSADGVVTWVAVKKQ